MLRLLKLYNLWNLLLSLLLLSCVSFCCCCYGDAGWGWGGLVESLFDRLPWYSIPFKIICLFTCIFHKKLSAFTPLSESATLWYKISDAHQHHTTSFLSFLFLACRYVGRKISAPFRSGSGEEVVEKTSVDGQCALSRSKNKKQHADVCK